MSNEIEQATKTLINFTHSCALTMENHKMLEGYIYLLKTKAEIGENSLKEKQTSEKN